MRKNLFYVCSALVAIVLLTECKKKKEDTVTPTVTYTKTEMLAGTNTTGSKSWKLTKETMSGTDVTSTFYSSCDLDNIYKFYRSGVYVELEGTTKCNSSDPDTVDAGTWHFNTAQDSIFIVTGNINDEKLKSLSTSSMEQSSLGFFGEVVDTYTAQ